MADSKQKSLAWLVATCGGLGELPKGSGTLASFVAIFFWWGLKAWTDSSLVLVAVSIALIPLGVWAARRLDEERQVEDSSAVVIDEWIGMGLSLAFAPMTFISYAIAFGLFRVFDISKPPGVRFFDQRYLKGWGVILDDVIAGLYVAIIFGVYLWVI